MISNIDFSYFKEKLFSSKSLFIFLGIVFAISFIIVFIWSEKIYAIMRKEQFILLDTEITTFIFLFTGFIVFTIFISWYYGGFEACLISAITWNFEILFYNAYSGKWGYSIEHISLLGLLLLFKESPADRKNRLLIEAEKQISAKEAENAELQKLRLVFQKMTSDVKQVGSSISQDIQVLEFQWTNIVKSVVANEKHDLLNKLTLSEMTDVEKKAYEKVLVPLRDSVIHHINNIPRQIDFECKDIDINELVEKIVSAIPDNFYNSNYEFNIKNLSKVPSTSSFAKINIDRANSIIYNILQNSSRAISIHEDHCYDKAIEYCGKISLSFDIDDVKNRFIVTIKDNGGGFNDNILNKIYKVPILSTKPSNRQRFGEGTTYVEFFVRYMNGDIEAENHLLDGCRYAVTRIAFPLFKKEASYGI